MKAFSHGVQRSPLRESKFSAPTRLTRPCSTNIMLFSKNIKTFLKNPLLYIDIYLKFLEYFSFKLVYGPFIVIWVAFGVFPMGFALYEGCLERDQFWYGAHRMWMLTECNDPLKVSLECSLGSACLGHRCYVTYERSLFKGLFILKSSKCEAVRRG